MDVDDPAYPLFTIHDEPDDHPQVVEPRPVSAIVPTRDVLWVLRWAAALTTIFVALVRLAAFGYQLAAEHQLVAAARAGALEATLPRATFQSVAQTVERRLQQLATPRGKSSVFVEQNGTPVQGALHPREGDRFSVVVTLPTQAALPGWLGALNFWADERPMEARAERRMPGRELHVPK